MPDSFASWMLAQEARALLTRVARVEPLALHESMVPAAAVAPAALTAIDRYLSRGRQELRGLVRGYLAWLESVDGRRAPPADAQRRLTFLRLRFNAIVAQFDTFADVLTQRSEHNTGVWLSGLDAVAADALALPGFYEPPPVICYLDRGIGAAIRRARTRLPGGSETPVAIVRVPRERMVGSGIASSLVHEVGHQGAALLDLVASLQSVLGERWRRDHRGRASVWRLWARWISEILADFWSVARLGISSTLGLIGVVSLPRAFVFRVSLDDPHPIPWIRVAISCAIGAALYPAAQWTRLRALWKSFYPTAGVDEERRGLFASLEASLPELVALLVSHRVRALRGRSLPEVIGVAARQPSRLTSEYQAWRQSPRQMFRARPTFVLAAIGQAKFDGAIGPEEEGNLLTRLLTYWALRGTQEPVTLAQARALSAPTK